MTYPKAQASCITPFTLDGELDEGALREHLARMVQAGLDIDVGTSGTGEGHLITADEQRRILEIAAEVAGEESRVCALGVEPRSAAQMMAFHRLVAETPVGTAQVYSLDVGHGYRPTRDEQERYFRTVIEATSLQLMLSSHEYGGYMIPLDLLGELVGDYPHIHAVMATTDDVAYLVGVHDVIAKRVSVFTGGPRQAVTNLTLGGQAYGSAEANLIPQFCADVCTSFAAGDIATVGDRYARIMRVWSANARAGGSVGIKAALRKLGLPGGYPREPRVERSSADLDHLLDVLRSVEMPEAVSA